MKILIALIHNRETMNTAFVSSLMSLYEETKKKHKVQIKLINGNFICQMRNLAAEYAIENKFDYLFQLDTDMIYPKDTILRLLKHKKDIIGGMYYTRKSPHNPVHWKKAKKNIFDKSNIEYFPENKLKAVELSAGGGVLIKTEVFKNLKFPYYQVRYNGYKILGEDIDFCYKIKGKYKFWIDPTVKYAHITQMAIVGENKFKEIL